MIIQKSFNGDDGRPRSWSFDTETNTVYVNCLAKDFDRYHTIKMTMKSAQELIDECLKDEGI